MFRVHSFLKSDREEKLAGWLNTSLNLWQNLHWSKVGASQFWTRCVAAAFSLAANWSSFEMPSKPVFVEHGEGCWSGIIFLDQFRFEFFLRWLWWVQLGLIRTNTVLTEAFSNQSLRHNITNPILGNEVCLKPFYTGCNALVLVQLIISDKKEFLRGSKFWPIFSLGMYLSHSLVVFPPKFPNPPYTVILYTL